MQISVNKKYESFKEMDIHILEQHPFRNVMMCLRKQKQYDAFFTTNSRQYYALYEDHKNEDKPFRKAQEDIENNRYPSKLAPVPEAIPDSKAEHFSNRPGCAINDKLDEAFSDIVSGEVMSDYVARFMSDKTSLDIKQGMANAARLHILNTNCDNVGYISSIAYPSPVARFNYSFPRHQFFKSHVYQGCFDNQIKENAHCSEKFYNQD